MDVYTYSEARQHLSSLLDEAESTGKVIIRRKDGRRYAVVPELPPASPLDVPLAGTDLTAKEDSQTRQAPAYQGQEVGPRFGKVSRREPGRDPARVRLDAFSIAYPLRYA